MVKCYCHRIKKKDYPHPPAEAADWVEERIVPHSDGAVSKLLQIAVL
jgi:hypothetical protein